MIVGNRLICRCSIHTGESTNYAIDYDITAVELRQSSDLYLLTDNIAVLVTYNPENYQFSQYVLALNDESENAVLTIKRTVTLPALNSSLTIGTGLLKDGYILVTGYTGPADDRDRQVVGLMIAADPYKASSLPNKDITSMIGQFEHFLLRSYPDLRIFAPGIFAEEDGLIFMLKRQVHHNFVCGNIIEYDLFETSLIGRAYFSSHSKDVRCRLIPVDNSSVVFARLLCIRHVRQVCHRDKNIWVTTISSDFAQLSTWRWRFYLSALLYIIKAITIVLRIVLWLRRIDGGVTLFLYIKLLRWLYGPSMIPVTAPPPTFNMYGLNMKSLKFRKVPIQPKLYSTENAFVSYPLAIDCDDTGGVITAELGSSVKYCNLQINYFPSQNSPLSLCKLAEHSVYRNFPAFEKSPLLRRSVGQLNWEHF
ncbi:hypothetical protein ANCCAN_15203 [Ancylostoma caninum]|uniref:Uncharacterized protein n=1 Tax=Ancylostoma caninum TaxID=29170 RepID=A0A368G5A3_ANCCA|nr:hypothetical protein ANCCAN_15203 [Ancylostoma caninum]